MLLAVEGVTILSVRQMITLHIYLGILLLGPVLLKTATTVGARGASAGGLVVGQVDDASER